MAAPPDSPFLRIERALWVAENDLAFAVRDRYAVSPGHTLIIPKRLVATWFDATADERLALLALIDVVKEALDRESPRPDGYNVGFNAGEAAGQTVMHLHVHVIPRFRGDVDDPRGGIRHVIPGKGNYLRAGAPFSRGGSGDPFARHVLPLFATAERIAIVAAFVQESGLDRIDAFLRRALARGAHVRLITGDYLEITQVGALDRLVDLQSVSEGEADDGEAGGVQQRGSFAARIVEVGRLPLPTRSFHPKSWRFEGPSLAVAFVGSSNLSRAALDSAIEWNLRVERARDADTYESVCAAFEDLWTLATPLDAAFVAAYEARARARPVDYPPGEIETDGLTSLPAPHAAQIEALERLRDARRDGRRRALVVLATGLGKTLLSVLDYNQLWEETGRRPRLLFLAHRRELLIQAARTFRRLFRERQERPTLGWFAEDHAQLDAELVFASVAKLSRPAHLDRLRHQRFDYVVLDEVHHATADSYRGILGAIDPGFLLGLTATPDRADGGDVLGIFDDFVASRAGIERGIELGRLVPFHYFGVKDDIDYQNIPWRNRRFDPDELANAAQTDARMQTMWRAWEAHPGRRTLVFCCSVAHAIFVRRWLRARGVKVAAIFDGAESDDREASLQAIAEAQLDAICAVDILNEGIDLPDLDRVVMLRPTESSVVFLQQLGRGLRATDGKVGLTVIDFVGNHRLFVDRLRTLLSLRSNGVDEVRRLIASDGHVDLPEGCSVDLEIEAKDLLARLFGVDGTDEVERAYREVRDSRGARPTAGELLRMGYQPTKLRDRHGSWFEFVAAEGDLGADDGVLQRHAAFLRDLEVSERMSRSFKMVTLQALLEHDSLFAGMPVPELAAHSHAVIRRSQELAADVAASHRFEALDASNRDRWVAYWREHPINAWTGDKKTGRTWFHLGADDRFALDFDVAVGDRVALAAMVGELVDYRLAQYRRRAETTGATLEGFVCRVLSNERDPILKLPSRVGGQVPTGETEARLADGSVWLFRFAKEFCNVARPAGAQRNQLPDLLRRWFGPGAGQPGTTFQVRFRAGPNGFSVEPERGDGGQVVALPRRSIRAYPDLRAAAGHAISAVEPPDADQVRLPIDATDPDLFAVRVSGSSMDGGRAPLRDGDWAVFRLARHTAPSSITGRVALVEVPGETTGATYQIKRVVQRDDGWWLASDNPEGPQLRATEEATVIARLDRSVRPEQLGPETGAVLADGELAERFGLESLDTASGRHDGHLFVFVDRPAMLATPEQVHFAVSERPSETAFVLAKRPDDTWRYLGVGRRDDEGQWRIPEVDHDTWQRWGAGSEVSRALPDGFRSRGQVIADTILALPESERWVEQADGRQARVVGGAARGGLRIEGIDGAFAERTVSLLDLAWVAVASDDRDRHGGLLDEERVNRLRYLEGTPRGSTRWIDTGWALAAFQRARLLIPTIGETTQVVDDEGRPVDARFHVEQHGDVFSVVIESRGGTKGSSSEQNTQYNEGLELLLSRLGKAGARLEDAFVDSSATRDLSAADRRLVIAAQPYPIAIEDAAALRSLLGRAQAQVGRRPAAKGSGNPTKRVRLVLGLDVPTTIADVRELLRGGNR